MYLNETYSLEANSIQILRKHGSSFRNMDEYFDALSSFDPHTLNPITSTRRIQVFESIRGNSAPTINHNDINEFKNVKQVKKIRRSQITPRPNYSNFKALVSCLKNSMGKDLMNVSFPITFSEPLSAVQRFNEILEESCLLDRASECSDSLEQMTYVVAFNISKLSSSQERLSKPFNSLLNETFEFDRLEDYGWRTFAEQVTHHPPRIAIVI